MKIWAVRALHFIRKDPGARSLSQGTAKPDLLEQRAARGVRCMLRGCGTSSCLSRIRTELNYSIRKLNFPIISGIFTKISQNFANFLQSSLSLDILEHVREIPTKFHLNFGEK